MKEYNENKWAKTIFVFLSLSLCLISLWFIWSRDSAFVVLGGIAFLAMSIYLLINTFAHKIILEDAFIVEKTLLKRKQIFFREVTHISIDSIVVEIKAGKEKINIGKFAVKNADEVIGFVVSKIKDNKGLLFRGDPILLQSYVNEFSDKKSFTGFNENNLTNFTFVENAEISEKRRLFRVINLKTSKGDFKITYFGKGMGYECVFVDDELVSKKDSNFWYVPKFDFNYRGMNISVNVRVNPWLTIKNFWIEVDNKIVYSE